jgi:hypothetical protein
MENITKRENEKKILKQMITLYCKHHHHTKTCCSSCQDLLNYAYQRIENCPNMETKTFCSQCENNCYNPKMRQQIRDIMRWSGPRMIFYHPLTVIHHFFERKQNKRRKQ